MCGMLSAPGAEPGVGLGSRDSGPKPAFHLPSHPCSCSLFFQRLVRREKHRGSFKEAQESRASPREGVWQGDGAMAMSPSAEEPPPHRRCGSTCRVGWRSF